jgi:ATP adenylyltransferase
VSDPPLWAPWRLEYIEAPGDDQCIFCTKPEAGDDRAVGIIHRGTRCYAILNAFPYTNGHLMIAPYEHVGSLERLDRESAIEMVDLTRRSLTALRAAYAPDGFNIGINEGKAGGAGFDEHVHQHVVPRWSGDTNFMAVIGEARVLPQSLAESYARLAEAFR